MQNKRKIEKQSHLRADYFIHFSKVDFVYDVNFEMNFDNFHYSGCQQIVGVLAAFVVGQGELGDEVLGVVRSDLHCESAGGVLGGVGVEEHGVEFQQEDLREEVTDKVKRVRL